jgi:hypothetical protein
VAPSPADLPRLDSWNELALARGIRWLQVLPPNGRFAALGPLFVPDETSTHASMKTWPAPSAWLSSDRYRAWHAACISGRGVRVVTPVT